MFGEYVAVGVWWVDAADDAGSGPGDAGGKRQEARGPRAARGARIMTHARRKALRGGRRAPNTI